MSVLLSAPDPQMARLAQRTTWTVNGANRAAYMPGPISARHMCEKPSLLPRQAMTSLSGSSRTPNFRKYLLVNSRRRFSKPFDLL